MTNATMTHALTLNGATLDVLIDGGEIYDAAHLWARTEGRPGIAQYEVSDVDADGNEILAVTINGKLTNGVLVAKGEGWSYYTDAVSTKDIYPTRDAAFAAAKAAKDFPTRAQAEDGGFLMLRGPDGERETIIGKPS